MPLSLIDLHDNYLIAHEVFHSFKNKTDHEGWITIKLDMEKAYDRLERDYIITTLENLVSMKKWLGGLKLV